MSSQGPGSPKHQTVAEVVLFFSRACWDDAKIIPPIDMAGDKRRDSWSHRLDTEEIHVGGSIATCDLNRGIGARTADAGGAESKNKASPHKQHNGQYAPIKA